MIWRPFVIAVYIIGMFFLLMPVYDQIVPYEESEETTTVTIVDEYFIYSVEVPVEASEYPLTRGGWLVDAYRFTEPVDCIRSLASQVESRTGFTGYALAEYDRNLVHLTIDYASDNDVHDRMEYWQLPSETLILGTGDCEDQTYLFVSLCRASGFECIMVSEPGHFSAAVLVDAEGNTVSYEGRDFLVADPIGSSPMGFSEPDVRFLYGTDFGREQIVFFIIDSFLIIVLNFVCIHAIMRT